ncbi:MarR family winged helix-turn-helix transcriptional regulator [Hyphomonas polymorpha]|nr:MarR family transcriptional regulator [Hyphomonas polymorpha]
MATGDNTMVHETLLEIEDAFKLLADMNVIQNHVAARFTADVPLDLSIAQFAILQFFFRRPGLRTSINQLADHLSLSKASVGDSVEKLKKKHYLLVEPNKEDRRSRLVSITEEGLKAHSTALAAIRPFLMEMRDGVGATTFPRAIALLQPLREWLRMNKQE